MAVWIACDDSVKPEFKEKVVIRLKNLDVFDDSPYKEILGSWQPFQKVWIAGDGPFIIWNPDSWRREVSRG